MEKEWMEIKETSIKNDEGLFPRIITYKITKSC